jgi:hypothetical protein
MKQYGHKGEGGWYRTVPMAARANWPKSEANAQIIEDRERQ